MLKRKAAKIKLKFKKAEAKKFRDKIKVKASKKVNDTPRKAMELEIPSNVNDVSLEIKGHLAVYAKQVKDQWEEEKKTCKRWCPRKKEMVFKDPKWDFIRRAVEDNFPKARDLRRFVSFVYIIFSPLVFIL